MITTLRLAVNHTVTKIIIGIVLFIFAFWGASDLFRNKDPVIVKFRKAKKITESELQNTFLNYKAHYIKQNSDIDDNTINYIKRKLLEQIINERLILNLIQDYEIEIDEKLMAKLIKRESRFHDNDGNFDKQKFNSYLSQYGIDKATYLKEIKLQMKKSFLFNNLAPSYIPRALTDRIINHLSEERVIDYVKLDTSYTNKNIISKVNTTDAELEEYYHKNTNLFQIPERRDIGYIKIGNDLFKVNIANKQISDYIKNNEDEFKNLSDKDAKEVAKDILYSKEINNYSSRICTNIEDEIAAGNNLSQIAKMLELPYVEIKDTTLEKLLTNKNLSHFASIIFNLNNGETSELMDLKDFDGYLVAQVNQITPPSIQPFEMVKGEVKKYYTKELYHQKNMEFFSEISKNLNSSNFIDNIKKHNFLKIKTNFSLLHNNEKLDLPQNMIINIFDGKKNEILGPFEDESKESCYLAIIRNIKINKATHNEMINNKNDIEFSIQNNFLEQLISYSHKENEPKINK